MKGRVRLRKKLALLGVASVAAVLLGEVVIRLFIPIPVIPFLRDFDPDHGVKNKKNLSATITYPEFTMQFSTNSRGFRGPEPPPSSDGCILFLGDSFTEGWGVDDGEEFPALVRERLDQRLGAGVVPVINASMSNTGNVRWINVLRDCAHFEPRLVVFQLCWNDSNDAVRDGQFLFEWPDTLIERPGQDKPWHRKIQPFLEIVPGLQYSRVFGLLRQLLRSGGHALGQAPANTNEPFAKTRLDRTDRLMLKITEKALTMCKERGWPTALITVMIGDPRLAALREICERFDTPLLDIRNRVEHPELYYEVDMHWNEAGHAWVAERVLDEWLGPESPYLQ